MTFRELQQRWTWRAIRDCPGRYTLQDAGDRVTMGDLLGNERTAQAQTFQPPRARDAVLVVALQDGGVISYLREDGTLLHTLNDLDGFQRKLTDLEITLNRE